MRSLKTGDIIFILLLVNIAVSSTALSAILFNKYAVTTVSTQNANQTQDTLTKKIDQIGNNTQKLLLQLNVQRNNQQAHLAKLNTLILAAVTNATQKDTGILKHILGNVTHTVTSSFIVRPGGFVSVKHFGTSGH